MLPCEDVTRQKSTKANVGPLTLGHARSLSICEADLPKTKRPISSHLSISEHNSSKRASPNMVSVLSTGFASLYSPLSQCTAASHRRPSRSSIWVSSLPRSLLPGYKLTLWSPDNEAQNAFCRFVDRMPPVSTYLRLGWHALTRLRNRTGWCDCSTVG